MGYVKVQSGNTSLGGTSIDVTIEAVNLTHAWVRMTSRVDADAGSHDVSAVLIDSTTLRLMREASSGTVEISWFVIEDSEATVIRGQKTFSGLTDTVTISAVDLSKSFISITNRSTGSPMNSGYVNASFTNNTTIRLEREDSTGDSIVEWQVITISNATVQAGLTTVTGTSATPSISVVDLVSSFLILHRSSDGENLHRSHIQGRITTTTQVALSRQDSTGQCTVGWFVVSCPRYRVQVADSGNTSTQNVDTTIQSVDLTRSFLTTSWENSGPGTLNNNGRARVRFLNDTTVRREKQATRQNTWANTFAIEMEANVQNNLLIKRSGILKTLYLK